MFSGTVKIGSEVRNSFRLFFYLKSLIWRAKLSSSLLFLLQMTNAAGYLFFFNKTRVDSKKRQWITLTNLSLLNWDQKLLFCLFSNVSSWVVQKVNSIFSNPFSEILKLILFTVNINILKIKVLTLYLRKGCYCTINTCITHYCVACFSSESSSSKPMMYCENKAL